MATENVTQLLRHFPFNTHVIVYSLDNNLVFTGVKGRLSQHTESWKRLPVKEWEVDTDGVQIWIDIEEWKQ